MDIEAPFAAKANFAPINQPGSSHRCLRCNARLSLWGFRIYADGERHGFFQVAAAQRHLGSHRCQEIARIRAAAAEPAVAAEPDAAPAPDAALAPVPAPADEWSRLYKNRDELYSQ
ncbi:hypothetical protein PF011_g16054 [Phytophthora fragariae]|uniref:Uncharacterized protein n=1 Tax=Phytophthora fragariae TaxID=53985 RepID=A0A6A3JV66_9STRA|nr:hypothetical protein PF011_g16054 [Phytophthora fragariae]